MFGNDMLRKQPVKRYALTGCICVRRIVYVAVQRPMGLRTRAHLARLINNSRQELFPVVIGALYTNSKAHWNGTVHGLTYNVLKLMMEVRATIVVIRREKGV